MTLTAQQIAEIRKSAVNARERVEGGQPLAYTVVKDQATLIALCDYALAAMEVEKDLAKVRDWEANLFVRRLRAVRGPE